MDCIYIGAYRTKNQIYFKKKYVWTLAVPSSSQDIPDNNYDFFTHISCFDNIILDTSLK